MEIIYNLSVTESQQFFSNSYLIHSRSYNNLDNSLRPKSKRIDVVINCENLKKALIFWQSLELKKQYSKFLYRKIDRINLPNGKKAKKNHKYIKPEPRPKKRGNNFDLDKLKAINLEIKSRL